MGAVGAAAPLARADPAGRAGRARRRARHGGRRRRGSNRDRLRAHAVRAGWRPTSSSSRARSAPTASTSRGSASCPRSPRGPASPTPSACWTRSPTAARWCRWGRVGSPPSSEPTVLAGRLPDPSRDDEAVITSALVPDGKALGLGVGSVLTWRNLSPADLEAVGDEPPDDFDWTTATGPVTKLRIVGVVRLPMESVVSFASSGLLLPSPAWAEAHLAVEGAAPTGDGGARVGQRRRAPSSRRRRRACVPGRRGSSVRPGRHPGEGPQRRHQARPALTRRRADRAAAVRRGGGARRHRADRPGDRAVGPLRRRGAARAACHRVRPPWARRRARGAARPRRRRWRRHGGHHRCSAVGTVPDRARPRPRSRRRRPRQRAVSSPSVWR